MTREEQLERWLAGDPQHNDAGEHCPDFSCCTGRIAPLETRQAFTAAFMAGDQLTFDLLSIHFIGFAVEA